MRIVCKFIIVKPKIRNMYNQIFYALIVLFYYFFYILIVKLEILPQLFCNIYMLFIPVLDKITN